MINAISMKIAVFWLCLYKKIYPNSQIEKATPMIDIRWI